MTTAPPRFAQWLLRLIVPPSLRTELVNALAERYQALVRERGRPAAQAWYWRQPLRFFSEAIVRPRLITTSRFTEHVRRRRRVFKGEYMRNVITDIRLRLRSLRRQPSFTAIAVLTLALGIGANSAMFSVVNGVVLRPLAYGAPEQLVMAWYQYPRGGEMEFPASAPEFVEFRAAATSFEGIAGFVNGNSNLGGIDAPLRVRTSFVTANMLSVLGVAPMLGRGFVDGEDRPGAPLVAVLTYGLWQRAFGGDPSIVGRSVPINGVAREVIGVMPRDFVFPGSEVELLRNLRINPQAPGNRTSHYLTMVGRLGEGVGLERAQSEIEAYMASWSAEFPNLHGPHPENHPIRLKGMHEQVVGDVQSAMFLLLGSVGLVLLVACANVASLLLVRGEAKQREVGIRTALGASRARLVQLGLVESGLLALMGSGVGLGLAWFGVRLFKLANPSSLPRVEDIQVDGLVTLFTLVAGVSATLVFGLVPAFRNAKSDLQGVLKEGAGGASPGRNRATLRQALVVGEIALAVMLVIGAGLLLTSLVRLQRVDTGFDGTGTVVMDLVLPSSQYPDGASVASLVEQLTTRLEALPGVTAAGGVRHLPLRGGRGLETLTPENREPAEDGSTTLQYQVAGPSFFQALGIPLVQGRLFTTADRANTEPVLLVNETGARQVWPDEDPIGKRIKMGPLENPNPFMTVVGVVGDVRQGSLDQDIPGQFYVPHAQGQLHYGGGAARTMTYVVRGEIDPASLMSAARGVVRELDPDLPVSNVATMPAVVSRSISDQRLMAVLLGLFAAIALSLGAIGVYGLMAHSVAQRTRELGIRIAMGADGGNIVRLVVKQGLVLAGIGVVLGLAGALAGTQILSNMVFSVGVRDPATFLGVSLLMGLVAVVAAYLPARRATRIDPIEALRSE